MISFLQSLFQSFLNGFGSLIQFLIYVLVSLLAPILDVISAFLALFANVAKLLYYLFKVGLGLLDVVLGICAGFIHTVISLASYNGHVRAPINGSGYEYASMLVSVLNSGGFQTMGYLMGAVVWLIAGWAVLKVVRRG